MLDFDLARLYECANGTKTINQAVKRHINKFPERYKFQLTKEEYLNLRFQFGTLEINGQGQYSKYLPYVFINQNPFHDRYIILGRSIVYNSGMSLKDVGKSYSYINRENEKIFIQDLLKRVNDMI
ncbi:MAG: ORF6N domain-containing protein [Bacilli bacterium]|nr:ORF6N domain-containing protein [Bacilli bacterium]